MKHLDRRPSRFAKAGQARLGWLGLAILLVVGVTYAAIALARRSPPPPRPVANRAFRTAIRPDAPATVWAVGDGADGGAAARAVARRIAAGRPDRVLFLGDVYPDGTASDFRGGFRSVYGSLARRTAPTPGNHDWPNHDVGYDPYWRSVTGAATPPWYAFRVGGWEVLSLNSEAPHGADSAQLRWLRARLRSDTGTCRLAFWHRPLHSAGLHGDQHDVAPLEDALVGHAALVLNGHDHDLQRLRPARGIVSLVVGAGGHGRYGVNSDDHGWPSRTTRCTARCGCGSSRAVRRSSSSRPTANLGISLPSGAVPRPQCDPLGAVDSDRNGFGQSSGWYRDPDRRARSVDHFSLAPRGHATRERV